MRTVVTALASFLLCLSSAFAQIQQGTITGTIADSDGALMPGVRIEARNSSTGAVYQVVSSPTGNYSFTQLPSGTYDISASVTGFRQYTRAGIAVQETQVMRIDIVLAMLSSDEILTNDSVLQLLRVGIDEDLIMSKIRDSQRNFDLSVEGMVALKEGGASDRLLRFIMNPGKPAESKTMPDPKTRPESSAASKEQPKPAAVPALKTDPGMPKEIGIYVKTDEKWMELQPEVIVWQTGGMLKRFATAGIVQGDVNGKIKGAHSSTVLNPPLEFVIITPEGVTAAEYQLIHLRKSRTEREFRTVTGGIFSSSGGATRDAMPFEGIKVQNRTYTVKLPALDEGEYGFLPTSSSSPGASSNVGKMYTFQVR